jgi:hypothetical protein
VVIISVLSTSAAVVLLILSVRIFCKNKQDYLRQDSKVTSYVYSSSSSQAQRRPLFQLRAAGKRDFNWEDIMDATNNLNDDFMIGSGGSGKIYS